VTDEEYIRKANERLLDEIERLRAVVDAARIHMQRGPCGGGGTPGSASKLREALAAIDELP